MELLNCSPNDFNNRDFMAAIASSPRNEVSSRSFYVGDVFYPLGTQTVIDFNESSGERYPPLTDKTKIGLLTRTPNGSGYIYFNVTLKDRNQICELAESLLAHSSVTLGFKRKELEFRVSISDNRYLEIEVSSCSRRCLELFNRFIARPALLHRDFKVIRPEVINKDDQLPENFVIYQFKTPLPEYIQNDAQSETEIQKWFRNLEGSGLSDLFQKISGEEQNLGMELGCKLDSALRGFYRSLELPYTNLNGKDSSSISERAKMPNFEKAFMGQADLCFNIYPNGYKVFSPDPASQEPLTPGLQKDTEWLFSLVHTWGDRFEYERLVKLCDDRDGDELIAHLGEMLNEALQKIGAHPTSMQASICKNLSDMIRARMNTRFSSRSLSSAAPPPLVGLPPVRAASVTNGSLAKSSDVDEEIAGILSGASS
jgi:hypothetical protein